MSLTFGSLFAGIGGFDLGFERAGMVCKWQVEINDYCNKVLAKHWPDVRRYKDVRECGKYNLETVDVICGGYPCQPHSVAGKQRGAKDDRDLWPEYRRIVAEIRPRWVVGENVPGIRTTILDQVLSDLEDLDYTAETLIIPACAFDAPHRRERVFVVAYTDKQRREKHNATSKRREDRDKSLSQLGALRNVLADTDRRNCNGREYQQEWQSQGGVAADGIGKEISGPGDVSNTNGRRRQQCHPKERGLSVPNPDGEGYYYYPWAVEPGICRVAYGLPNRVDRLRTLGNAVVPQVAEWIGRMIVEIDTG